jgi:hypothetical protein
VLESTRLAPKLSVTDNHIDWWMNPPALLLPDHTVCLVNPSDGFEAPRGGEFAFPVKCGPRLSLISRDDCTHQSRCRITFCKIKVENVLEFIKQAQLSESDSESAAPINSKNGKRTA